MSLRILHVTPYFEGAWAYGGIPRLAATLTREQARRGHRVTVCTTDVCTRERRLPRADRGAVADSDGGVDVRVFPNLSNRLAYDLQFFTPLGLARYLHTTARQFDVAHIHAHRHVPEALAVRALTRADVPYVLAPNGTAPALERRVTAKRIWDVLCGSRDLARAAAIVAVSETERRQLHALGASPAKVRVIGNPVDLDEMSPPPMRGAFRRALGLRDEPLVVFLGKLTPRKRLDVGLRALARARSAHARLVIVGNDMGARDAAERLVDELNLRSQTTFTGLLTGRARLEALTDADVVIYPSADEIFGLVPLEALLCGTPAIAADDSGCGEILRTLSGGIVVPLGDADALAAAIDRVLAEPAAWRAKAEQGAEQVRARFGGAVIAEQMDALYHELLGR